MDIKLDKSNPIPIGVQVKEQIKMYINSGFYKEGDKLPSINQFASSLDINKNTIVTILKDLEKDGYVKGFRGKGVFISKGKANKAYDSSFIDRIDMLIREAKKKKLDINELINYVSARFYQAQTVKNNRVLFIIGISQELVDLNLQKLKQSFPGVQFDGLLYNKETKIGEIREVIKWADIIVSPSVFFSYIKTYVPDEKILIKTEPNFKLLGNLRKGIDKKSKIAVIGSTQNSAELLSNMFIAASIFRPKMVLSLNDLEKYKKDLKEIDSFVICISARAAVEKLKLKEREVHFFSDYIDSDSMDDIKLALKKL
jgi:DNA-binding transcriptional regulator YhcF (GntR family)